MTNKEIQAKELAKSLQLFVKMQKLKSNQRMMTSASWSIIPMAAMPSKSSLTISTRNLRSFIEKPPAFFPTTLKVTPSF